MLSKAVYTVYAFEHVICYRTIDMNIERQPESLVEFEQFWSW